MIRALKINADMLEGEARILAEAGASELPVTPGRPYPRPLWAVQMLAEELRRIAGLAEGQTPVPVSFAPQGDGTYREVTP
jgi:hypothetical protein